MKKMKIFFVALLCAQMSFGQQLPRIDVSGRAGQKGSSGIDYSTSYQSSGYGRGSDGRNGGDAGRSTPGQDGGNITVNIRDKEIESGKSQIAIVELDASILTADGQQTTRKAEFSAGHSGFMYLQANGGRGGGGGVGGDGEGGQQGCSGRDATRSSDGTNGCAGGNGGMGGDGTAGSKGGNGGKIKVELKAADAHLALMVSAEAEGGEGGDAGRNGSGGQAGPGGRGGSSHSWTTTERDGEDCHEVNNGNGTSRRVCSPRYKTTSHSRSGGSSGSSGMSGRSGSGNISAGPKGSDGQFTFVVDNNGQKQQYSRPFSIRIREYEIVDQNKDNIYEPGETLTIQNLKVQNVGPMPWNGSKADFLVFLENTGWILAEPVALKVPSLGPNESIVIPGNLKFRIKQTDSFGLEKRWSANDSIVPKNLVTRINRTQEDFSIARPLTITFPLEITPLVSKFSVGAGETRKILWKVKNISTQSIGKDSAGLRTLLQNLKIAKDSEQDVEFRMKGEGDFNLLDKDRLIELALLKPGEEILIEGEMKFSEDSMPYTDRDVEVDLNLGQLNDPTRPQKIQQRGFKFKISQLYNYNAAADWILIVNNNTTREEFLAWTKLSKELGIKMDVWDVSYYGKLMFSQTMTQHKNSFTENYSRKTAIILNNSLQSTPDDAVQRPLDRLSQQDFIESMIKGGLNVVVIGPEQERHNVFEKLVVDKNDPQKFDSTKDLVANIQQESQKRAFGIMGFANVSKIILFGQPSDSDLREKATEVAKKLLELKPEERFVVSYDLDYKKLGWFTYGTRVSVQKALSPVLGKLVVLDVDERSIHTEQFVLSAENIYSVLEAMNYGYKLKIFANMPNLNSAYSEFVAEAVLRDLVTEQDFALQASMNSGRWEYLKRAFNSMAYGKTLNDGLDRKYRCLMGLDKCQFKEYKKLDVNTKLGSEVLRIVAGMKFYASHVQGWTALLKGNAFLESILILKSDMNQLAQSVVTNHFPNQREQALKRIEEHIARYEQQLSERNKVLIANSSLENAQAMVKKKSIGATYSTDRMFKPENVVRPNRNEAR